MKKRSVICCVIVFLASALVAASPAGVPWVRIDPQVTRDLSSSPIAQFLVVLRPQVDTTALAAGISNRSARGQAVFSNLRQVAETSQAPLRQVLNSLGARYRPYWIVNVIAVEGDQRVLDAMAARPEVASVESNRPFRVPLERPSSESPNIAQLVQWNIQKVNAPGVWAHGYTGQGITYANADTGVQWNHPALKPHYRGWNGSSANHNYQWWDAIHQDLGGLPSFPCPLNSPAPCDDFGHGTHTMGTGVGDDGSGNQIGMAPGAKWIACRNMQGGVGQPSTYIECFQFFMAPTDLNGNNPDPSRAPDVVGNSYGCPPSEGCTAVNVLKQAMDNLFQVGIFMAVSAGNYGPSCSTVLDPPAIYASAISVGATDTIDAIAAFSSRGPVMVDGSNRLKPDVSAPGDSVISSYPTNTYAQLSGTSMAAPHVAGQVALLWSAYPQWRKDVGLTRSLIEATAVDKFDSSCGPSGSVPNNVFGYGRIDAIAAYNCLGSPTCPFGIYREYVPFIWAR